MTRRLVFLAIPATLLFTGCGLNQQWEDDDVYVVKEARTPTDADISDESDYSTYTQNREIARRNERYYDQRVQQMFMLGIYTPIYGNYAQRGWGYGYHYTYNYGWGGNPYGMYGCNSWMYGNPYYNPYGGYYGQYPYGYGGYSSYNYGSPAWGAYTSPGVHIRGPRGSSSGYGGVSSRNSATYKTTTAPVGSTTDRRPVIAKPVTSQSSAGRTTTRVAAPSSPSRSTATPAPGRTSSPPTRTSAGSGRTPSRKEGGNVSTPTTPRSSGSPSSGSGSRPGSSGSSGGGVSRTSPGRR